MVDAWLPGNASHKVEPTISNNEISRVVDLIDEHKRERKSDLIYSTFSREETDRIVKIPLAMKTHEDFMELEECEFRDLIKRNESTNWCPPDGSDIKLNFNTAFDESQAKSISRLVVRNASGEVLVVKTMAHEEVASPFATEANVYLQVVLLRK
ncbi:hypothetical protein Goarm_023440 [Gossypium armourianum]|uniref:Uncharacterized protein n=1 Tax=Gossypium armourianum TaxID=34283 RepID=A0A7J9KFM8_9ROSI|nr:hypothetical protein [Gossypium armourianum]